MKPGDLVYIRWGQGSKLMKNTIEYIGIIIERHPHVALLPLDTCTVLLSTGEIMHADIMELELISACKEGHE